MSSQTHLAEKTLRAFQKRRSTPACYPCFKRKVKCRGGQPCEACVERKHPEICHVEELSKGSRRHPKRKAQSIAPSTMLTPVDSVVNEPNLGELSTIKFIKNSLESREGQDDALPAMGIGIGIGNPRFSVSFSTTQEATIDQKDSSPSRAEIIQYYASFRDLVLPIYPLIPDPFAFESLVGELLRGTDTPTKPESVALVLSCLALGAQFTETHIDGRWEISQDFIVRANTYLQKANCIFEPSTEAIQALLMIGIGWQNLGLSNGAWNLLGLTYRCAQSLGLHKFSSVDNGDYEHAMLWTAIIWQDCLMSLRYDRKPLTRKEQRNEAGGVEPILQPYFETMRDVCWAGIEMLHQSPGLRRDPGNVSSQVQYLEHLVASARAHLSPLCTGRTLQHKFQYYALRTHSSLLIAEICRPGFSTHDGDLDHAHKAIRQKGVHYLFVVVESFLELCAFSNVPFRSWSLMQGAISCALVLALIDSKRPLPKTQSLLRRLVDALRLSDIPGIPRPSTSLKRPEIYSMHEKSASLLESILNRTNNASFQGRPAPTAPTSSQATMLNENTFDLVFDEYLTWPTESLFDNSFSDTLLQANLHEDIFNL